MKCFSLFFVICVHMALAGGGVQVETDVAGANKPTGLSISLENTHDFPVSVYYDDKGSGIFMASCFKYFHCTFS